EESGDGNDALRRHRCGNGVCGTNETCSSCPADCGPCADAVCGDGACNGAETCSSCARDCGLCPAPPPACRDRTCGGAESCSTCPSDCGACPVDGNIGDVPLKVVSVHRLTPTSLSYGANQLTYGLREAWNSDMTRIKYYEYTNPIEGNVGQVWGF